MSLVKKTIHKNITIAEYELFSGCYNFNNSDGGIDVITL